MAMRSRRLSKPDDPRILLKGGLRHLQRQLLLMIASNSTKACKHNEFTPPEPSAEDEYSIDVMYMQNLDMRRSQCGMLPTQTNDIAIEATQLCARGCAKRPEVLTMTKSIVVAMRLLCAHFLAHEEHRNPRSKQSQGANDTATRLSPIAVAIERAIHCGLDGAGRMNGVIPDSVRGVAGLVV